MFELIKPPVSEWAPVGNTQRFAPTYIDTICPHCARSPITFTLQLWENRSDQFYMVSRCPSCKDNARFWLINPPDANNDEAVANTHLYIFPTPPLSGSLEEGIAEISPSFVRIYNQALMAESLGLNDLNGMGYRKALEFLIKDYLCQQKPDKVDEIRGRFLGNCIHDFIEDPRIKDCAERATWLGNDETHYIRSWEDKDINDLKMLLNLTRHWISFGYLTEKYLKDMPAKSKKK